MPGAGASAGAAASVPLSVPLHDRTGCGVIAIPTGSHGEAFACTTEPTAHDATTAPATKLDLRKARDTRDTEEAYRSQRCRTAYSSSPAANTAPTPPETSRGSCPAAPHKNPAHNPAARIANPLSPWNTPCPPD